MKKTCLNCGNKNCFIVYGVPDNEKTDVQVHHETCDYNWHFDCKKHNKWEEKK